MAYFREVREADDIVSEYIFQYFGRHDRVLHPEEGSHAFQNTGKYNPILFNYPCLFSSVIRFIADEIVHTKGSPQNRERAWVYG